MAKIEPGLSHTHNSLTVNSQSIPPFQEVPARLLRNLGQRDYVRYTPGRLVEVMHYPGYDSWNIVRGHTIIKENAEPGVDFEFI